MIHVIAYIRIRPGRMDAAREVYRDFVPKVNAEKGCIEYVPTTDLDTGLPRQELDGDVITVVEKWEDLDAFKAHLTAPHVLVYRENVKDIVEGVSIKILNEMLARRGGLA